MLHFLSPGTPLSVKTSPKLLKGLEVVKEIGLDGEEIQFGHGIWLKEPKFAETAAKIKELNLQTTIHAPYYVNLNAKEAEKREASIARILQTARVAHAIGAHSICFHPAYRFKNTRDEITTRIRELLQDASDQLEAEGINVHIRPESAGKKSQFGILDEIIDICEGISLVKPCIDFAHLMATSDGTLNNYDAFCDMLETIKLRLGPDALKEMHIHAGSVAFSDKGELHALNLDDPESPFNFTDLLKALIDFEVEGWIVAETPAVEEGALLLQKTYHDLKG